MLRTDGVDPLLDLHFAKAKQAMICILFNPLYTGNPITGTLANSECPDESLTRFEYHYVPE